MEEFGLSWREILHLAAGPCRAAVPARWHWVPTRTVVDDPALVHWADPVKPWDAGYTAGAGALAGGGAARGGGGRRGRLTAQTFSMCNRVRRSVR